MAYARLVNKLLIELLGTDEYMKMIEVSLDK